MEELSLRPIIGKLESLFSKLNRKFYNGELEKPVITVNQDVAKGALGWCTTSRVWRDQQNEDGYYEINICAEHLAEPFEQIAQVLLHEMAHLWNFQHGIQDTSRGNTYHNKKFKATAEQHGLNVLHDDKYGWTITSLNMEATVFVNSLEDVETSLHRKKFPKQNKSTCKQSTRKYVCPDCGCIIRATKKVHIICGDCEIPFEEEGGE